MVIYLKKVLKNRIIEAKSAAGRSTSKILFVVICDNRKNPLSL